MSNAINKAGAQSMQVISKKITLRIFKALAVIVCLVIVLGAAERNWFGYAWRTVQLAVQGDNGLYGIGNDPETIMEQAAANADGSTTILAVGDIVSCPEADGFMREIATLLSWVGVNKSFDPREVTAAKTVMRRAGGDASVVLRVSFV